MRIDWGAALFSGLLSGAISAVWLACSHQYTPPVVPSQQDINIYNTLVDAGCMAPDEGGPVALDQAHARVDQPAWLACLYADAGSVTTCSAPCK